MRETLELKRPVTRADCANVPRPCPWVGCRHTLYLDVSEAGSIHFPHADREPWEMPPSESCSLDVAERGGLTLEEVGDVLNVTRERVRQLEFKSLRHYKALGGSDDLR